jgi:DNA-binding LacI/PurR family transcriptional regulator
VLNKRHWQLIVQAARPKEQDYPDLMRRLGADGAVLVNTHHRDAGLGSLIRSRFPLVAIGSFGDSRVPQVTVDNAAAAAHVTEYLLGLGHTAIAMILHAPEMYHFSRDRLEGYRRALRAAGVPYRAALVHVGDFTVDSGYRQMQAFLRSSPRPTAVFGGSDSMAAGALRAIHDAGLRVPDDLSVAGFEDDLLSRYLFPPLTSLSLPAEGMGATAAAMVLDRIEGSRRPSLRPVVLPTSLSIRMSCAEAPGNGSSERNRSPTRLRPRKPARGG